MYTQFIIHIAPELNALRQVMTDIDMPHYDEDAMLSRIFHCFQDELHAMDNLQVAATDMANHDALFENEYLYQGQRLRIFNAVMNLGAVIKSHFDRIRPYNNLRKFPYSYKRMFNGCAVLVAD